MRIIHDLDEMTQTARGWLSGGRVGLVAVMGGLHEGHLSLILAARRDCEICIVTLFSGLGRRSTSSDQVRPRDLARDLHLLDNARVDVVFIPRPGDIYPPDFSIYVTPTGALAQRLEGTFIPDRLRGVATTITKLFHLVRPDVTYFGQKDAQQVALVRKLVRDLNIDVRLVVLPTTRELDGLAISSRNSALSAQERGAATVLYQALLTGKALIENGERRPEVIERAMAGLIAAEPLVQLDYAAVCDPDTFRALKVVKPKALLAVSAHAGPIRLLDNILWISQDHWLL